MKIKNCILFISCFLLITGCGITNSNEKKAPLTSPREKITEKVQKQGIDSPLNLNAENFNKIKVINGIQVIQNPANILVLVNKTFYLPANYIPNDLVRPRVAFSFGDVGLEKALLRKPAALAVEKMFAAAKDSGIELYAVSGYRSYSRQKGLFDAEVRDVGENNAEEAVAVPGTSEHQSGLALDICGKSSNLKLTESFAETKEGKWLAVNAYRFGFILRYPKGKEEITHYEYEPWHYRYVGVKAASIIYKHHWTLEEYINEAKKT